MILYISSNQIYKKYDTYAIELQYPSKLYDTFTTQTATTFLGQASYQESITLNNTGISYGVGQYDIYVSSSGLMSNRAGKQLFNYVLNEEADSCHFLSVYNASGFYTGTADYINSGYYGDWVVIKLPNPIILTKFSFYMRPTIPGIPTRAPSLWKCYGSIDGITFIEIVEASNTTALTSGNYTSSKYEKKLNTTFNTPYIYIGFCYNKIIGSGGLLNFAELQIFGKELLETPIYVSSNVLKSILSSYSTTIDTNSNINIYINTNNSNTSNFINNLSSSTNTNFINTSNYVSSKFLSLTGGIMTGQITGITTINASTGIFSTVSTTNNTNKAIPAVGNFGGIGDKIVFYNGTSTTYPYSLGIETNALWLSSPSAINFYNNGSNSIIISSNGEFIATNRIKENSQYLSDIYSTNSNTSNYINTSVSGLLNYTNTNNSNTSNYISTNVLNLSNLCININTNTSNFTRKTNVILPNTKFWYDGVNGVYCYDLNIEQYVKSTDLGNSYKARAFRISTYVPEADWRTKWNLYFNNQYINYPETLTIYMNNNSKFIRSFFS